MRPGTSSAWPTTLPRLLEAVLETAARIKFLPRFKRTSPR